MRCHGIWHLVPFRVKFLVRTLLGTGLACCTACLCGTSMLCFVGVSPGDICGWLSVCTGEQPEYSGRGGSGKVPRVYTEIWTTWIMADTGGTLREVQDTFLNPSVMRIDEYLLAHSQAVGNFKLATFCKLMWWIMLRMCPLPPRTWGCVASEYIRNIAVWVRNQT